MTSYDEPSPTDTIPAAHYAEPPAAVQQAVDEALHPLPGVSRSEDTRPAQSLGRSTWEIGAGINFQARELYSGCWFPSFNVGKNIRTTDQCEAERFCLRAARDAMEAALPILRRLVAEMERDNA